MRRHVQEPGVRKWSGTDLIELENEPLEAIDRFFSKYGSLVIEGCEVNEAAKSVSKGLVGLYGKSPEGENIYHVCRFKGATNVSRFPVYLALKHTGILRQYEDQVSRLIAYEYEAELLYDKPSDRQYIQLGVDVKNQFTDRIQDANHRMVTDVEKKKWDDGLLSPNHQHDLATIEKAGFMSPGDKVRVDKIDSTYDLMPVIAIPSAVTSLNKNSSYQNIISAFGGKFNQIYSAINSGNASAVVQGKRLAFLDTGSVNNDKILYIIYMRGEYFIKMEIIINEEAQTGSVRVNENANLDNNHFIKDSIASSYTAYDHASIARALGGESGFKELWQAIETGKNVVLRGEAPTQIIYPLQVIRPIVSGYHRVDIRIYEVEYKRIRTISIRDTDNSYTGLSITFTDSVLEDYYELPFQLFDLSTSSPTSDEISDAIGGVNGFNKIKEGIIAGKEFRMKGGVGELYLSISSRNAAIFTEENKITLYIITHNAYYGVFAGTPNAVFTISYDSSVSGGKFEFAQSILGQS